MPGARLGPAHATPRAGRRAWRAAHPSEVGTQKAMPGNPESARRAVRRASVTRHMGRYGPAAEARLTPRATSRPGASKPTFRGEACRTGACPRARRRRMHLREAVGKRGQSYFPRHRTRSHLAKTSCWQLSPQISISPARQAVVAACTGTCPRPEAFTIMLLVKAVELPLDRLVFTLLPRWGPAGTNTNLTNICSSCAAAV